MLALCSRSEGSGIVRQPWFISAGRKTNTARTTRLAHQVENGLALHYHQTGSVMIASARPPKKELMQKNIRMSSTLVMTRPLWIRRDHGGAKGYYLQPVVRDGVSRSLPPKINFHATR